MPMYYLTICGIVSAAIGWGLVWLFGERANRVGIGSFTLLPLAGFGYVIGVLCIVVGVFFMLLGMFG